MQHAYRNVYRGTPAQMLRMFTDADFYKAKYELLGSDAINVMLCRDDSERFEVSTKRESPPSVQPPAFAAPFVPALICVTQLDQWNRAALTGHTQLRFDGMPVSIDIESRLEAEDDEHSVLSMQWDLKVDIPLMGRKLEKLLLEAGLHEAEREAKATQKLLKQYQ